MGSQFPKLFHQYYAIHETIHAILHETNGAPLESDDIERRLKEAHPDLEMGPATLAAAIRQAVTDAHATMAATDLTSAPVESALSWSTLR